MKVLHHFSKWTSGAVFASVLALAIGLTGTGYGQSFPLAPTEETTVTIGALLPLTGSLSITGETAKAALQIAEMDFEREFPLAHVELAIEDTATDAATALSKLQSMYQQGVRIFVGPFSSEELLHVKSFADENGCMLISPTSTAPSL